jgi:hypothetical protein
MTRHLFPSAAVDSRPVLGYQLTSSPQPASRNPNVWPSKVRMFSASQSY